MSFDEKKDLLTSVTLFVPEDAKVTLGGMETNASGTMRYFSTTTLEEGKAWEDYKGRGHGRPRWPAAHP